MGGTESKDQDVEYNTLKDQVKEWDGGDAEKNKHIADFHQSIAERSRHTDAS